MKNTFLFIYIVLASSITSIAQVQLNLLNGNQIKLESYVFHSHENYMDYSFINKKGKSKQSYADLDKVYSISLNGKDSIMYEQILEDEFTVDEMSRIVMARQFALKEYKPWWAFASGMVVGCGTMFLPFKNGTAKVMIPIFYTAGMAFVRPSDSYVRKHHEEYMYDDLFVYGYKSTGRKKIFKNTTLGVLGGVLGGILISGIMWSSLTSTIGN